MPGATSPDNIYFLNASDPFAPHTVTASVASSVQTALSVRQIYTFRWSTVAEKDAETGMDYGSIGYCEENGYVYVYDVFSDEWKALNGAPAYGIAGRTTNVSVSSSTTFTQTSLDTFDLSGGFTSGTNSLIVPEDGPYSISVRNAYEQNSSGNRGLIVKVNGSNSIVYNVKANAGTNSMRVTATGLVVLSAGDELTVNRWQNSGGPINEISAGIEAFLVR